MLLDIPLSRIIITDTPSLPYLLMEDAKSPALCGLIFSAERAENITKSSNLTGGD
jgi:hypothetical protein